MMFSGSIVSTSANLPPWQRKESVTIIERADEDEKDAEDEPEVDLIKKPELDPISCYRYRKIIHFTAIIIKYTNNYKPN